MIHMHKKAKIDEMICKGRNALSFGDCLVEAATPYKRPASSITVCEVNRAIDWLQEGEEPMAYCEKTEKTDAAVTRDYLLTRLENVAFSKERTDLRKLFNVDVNGQPQTYKDLIDWIKNDKYTLDTKITARIDSFIEDEGCYYGGAFEGIKWTGKPQPDFDGFAAARIELAKQKIAAKDIIMTDASAALKALQDFEAWLPAVTSN